MSKFLYGASVQGIQQFIFQTNELKDIVGASELVENICTTLFKQVVGKAWEKENSVIAAAGNVKYIFDDEELCRQVVRLFPRTVMAAAPGITLSQAVVELEDDFMAAVDALEKQLRIQRNKPKMSLTLGRLGLWRSKHTGLPVIKVKDGECYDASTLAKKNYNKTIALCQKSFGEKVKLDVKKSVPFDVSTLTDKNDWIAVIHADGNGLGKVVQKVGRQMTTFKTFSQELDNITTAAANAAFQEVKPEGGWTGVIPIRPIVLGGDDMTVIIRGDLALRYVTAFMKQFEKYTSEGTMRTILEQTGLQRLTICAGVAFINSSYPFYYGYELAEQLCKEAKDNAKKQNETLPPSCLMFHKVQDSFVMKYAEIKKRELTTASGNSLCFGPYYLEKQQAPTGYFTIDELEQLSQTLNAENAEGIKTGIRQWLTLMHEDEAKAQQRLKRLKALNAGQHELIGKLTIGRSIGDNKTAYPAYDVLAFHTIMNQQTKEEKS